MKSEWDADEMDLINADRVDELRDLWSELRDTRTEVAKLTAKLARSERWRIKNDATLVAENLRLRAVIAEAAEDAEWASRAWGSEFSKGVMNQAEETLEILAKATQTDKEAGI